HCAELALDRVLIGRGELIARRARRSVMMGATIADLGSQQIVGEQRGLRRSTIPEDRRAVGMCTFVRAAVFPAPNDAAVERHAVGDQEAIQGRAIAVRAWWVVGAAGQTAERQRGLHAAVPV